MTRAGRTANLPLPTAGLVALVLAGLAVTCGTGVAQATHRSEAATRPGPVPVSDKSVRSPVESDIRRVPSLRSAGRFLLTEVELKVRGSWVEVWHDLHPFHRRIAPLETFVRCETATPFPAPLESIRVVDVRAASVRVPGLRRAVPGAAVTTAVELTWYGPRDPITFEHTFHLVPVRGRWTWILSSDRYRLYLAAACPGHAV